MWKRVWQRLVDFFRDKHGCHVFEMAISFRDDDGRLAVMRCRKCGYCCYLENAAEDHPACVPQAHDWQPRKAFNWGNVAIANKLDALHQCALCGAYATTRTELEKLGCPGYRKED